MIKTLIFGHRGCSKEAPENTMSAFKYALDCGADGVELDIRYTKDDEIVVFHDPDLKRLFGLSARVDEMTAQELLRLDFGNYMQGFEREHIPLFSQVLEMHKSKPSVFINVEIKADGKNKKNLAVQAALMARAAGLTDRIIFSSFDEECIKAVSQAVAGAKTALLFSQSPKGKIDLALQNGCKYIHPSYKLIRPSLLIKARLKGLLVNTYTVDSPFMIRRLIAMRINAIITNEPKIAVAIKRGFKL